MVCLIVRDQKSKATFGHPVPQKGIDAEGYSVQRVVGNVKWLVYTNVTLKSDNEPSILKLVSTALGMLRVQAEIEKISEEHSHRYGSQTNGATEVAVRELGGHHRAIKGDLESKIGYGLNPTHLVGMRVAEHCAMILNVRAVGADGKTPWRRIQGREFNIVIPGFAEQALCKLPMKGLEKVERGNAAPNFVQATYFGFGKATYKHRLIDGEGGPITSRHAVAMPLEKRWGAGRPRSVTSTPWKGVLPKERAEPTADKKVEAPSVEIAGKASRKSYIMPWVLSKFGYTMGCPQCTFRSLHNRTKEGVMHSAACRERLWGERVQSQDG